MKSRREQALVIVTRPNFVTGLKLKINVLFWKCSQILLVEFRRCEEIPKSFSKLTPIHLREGRGHQLAAAELLAIFFNFFNSFDAQMDRVLALLCLLLLPCPSISLMGSRSRRWIIGAPKALHKSPTRPAATAIVVSEWSASWATTKMNWTMNGTWGSNNINSGDGVGPSPFKPCMIPVYASSTPSRNSLR